LHDDAELVDLLFSVKTVARTMADEASQARLHIATMGKELQPTFIGTYTKIAAKRGSRAVRLVDELLAALDRKFGLKDSLLYQPSPGVAALMRDLQYPYP
jgi:hypothetical protein